MRKRTVGLLVAALLVLVLGILGCAISQSLARRLTPTTVPTRTPRPTWTPAANALAVATPTLDLTRFPNLPVAAAPQLATPQVIVPGQQQPLVVPQGSSANGVVTVVVVIVTATPPPPANTALPAGLTPRPAQTFTPGLPLATPAPSVTPPPPVVVHVTQDQVYVRQGPGVTYPPVTRLDTGTTVTVVGRNRAGDWWKICCVNGGDVWISDTVVKTDGPLWTVPEVPNIPPPPTPTPTPANTPTPAPTPTYAWPFRLESAPVSYALPGQNIFRVDAVIYNGATPLWGYKLKIRKLSTGQEWLSDGSEAYWKYETIEWGANNETPQVVVQRNVKWDSNSVSIPMDDGVWEVTCTDGAGNALSQPVQFQTSASNPRWYYVKFTSK